MSTAQSNHPANMPQAAEIEGRRCGANFTQIDLGKVQDLSRYAVHSPRLGVTLEAKVFLNEHLDLTAMEISYGLMPPQTSLPFLHKHKQNEEVYLFLSGRGEYQVDGEVMPIREGSAVRVSTDGVRAFRNTSDEPMFYVVIQAKTGSLEQWTRTDGVGVPGAVEWPSAG